MLVQLLLATGLFAGEAERPNIILILCDDLGYADVSFNGSPDIRTPELDKLAEQGTVLTSAYNIHPFCGPSRMGLMTGRYPHEFGAPFNLPNLSHGIEEYNRLGVPVNEPLFSTVLQDAGYYTGIVGKWHMGITAPYHPNNRGFDDFYGFLGGGHNYFPEQFKAAYERQVAAGNKHIFDYLLPLEHNGQEVDETEYITDALSREAVRFIKDAATKDQPFFLYLAYNAPHTPLEAKEEDIALYSHIKDEKRRVYAAMVHSVDEGVGRVVEALGEVGKLDNTLIIFLSDNGGRLDQGGANQPLRGGKGDTWEGGFRTPMFFHWPKGVAAGQTYDHPVSTLDFYPTFARLAGADIPEGKELDGVDLWDAFTAGESARKGKTIYVMRHRLGYTDVGARQDNWKVIRVYNRPWKLFDMSKDLGETKDLSKKHPELVRSIAKELEAWSRTHTEPKWHHELPARDKWYDKEMPRFDETFQID
ncbi:MAG: sulfatase-like hydrolase/transferase [Puniceicoccaceae bacterium]